MRYRVSMPEPRSHLFHIGLTVEEPGESFVIAFPVWTPGSYLVREFQRHVEGLDASGADGRPARVERLDKRRFRVHAGGGPRATVRYRVYANEISVRTSHLDGSHAHWNGANLFFAVEGREARPHVVEVDAPENWRISTALPGGPREFRARDFDALLDSPFEVGTHEVTSFPVDGKTVEVAFWGNGGPDRARFTEDFRKIVAECSRLMGGLPFERYLMIVIITEKRRGGLEHADSAVIGIPRNAGYPGDNYDATLALTAHEFFHLWNVKRLLPARLRPFDYSGEMYTALLWWFEGVTSYYENLILSRAGLRTPRRLLQEFGEKLTAQERRPGTGKMTLEEASLTTWIKYYRPDENSPNSAISYYDQGELAGLALDLRLRREGSSLDALLRALWENHREAGVPEDGIEREVAAILGASEARAFLDRLLRCAAPIEPDFGGIGLAVRRRPADSFEDKGGTPAKERPGRREAGWLGVTLANGARLTVSSVRAGGPAEKAGICPEDEILAESGFRVDRAALWDLLEERGPGGTLRLAVFRRDELVEVEVPLAPLPEDTVWLAPVEGPTPEQKAAFEAWSGQPFPSGR